jgi:hypothetical protein
VETPSLAHDRWHAPPEDGGGRWNAPAATFYVDGTLVERSVALPGQVRDTWLPLPAVSGFKRISVLVSPPFVPAEGSIGGDQRQLGVFIHSVTSAAARPALGRPADVARPPG